MTSPRPPATFESKASKTDGPLSWYRLPAFAVLCTLVVSAPGYAATRRKVAESPKAAVLQSTKNDVSPPLREIPPKIVPLPQRHLQLEPKGFPEERQKHVD